MSAQENDPRLCGDCGTEIIDDCPVCSAPQCCPKCCRETVRRLLRELAAMRRKLDPRLGLPSASSMHRAASCPGSVNLERQCPPEPPGPDAERGTRIHRWLSHGDVALTEGDLDTAVACERMREEAYFSWVRVRQDMMHDGEVSVINREERLWLSYDPPMGYDVREALACSGQPDIVYAQDNRALVIDYKTGWEEPDPIQINWQIRTLAVVTAENSDGEIDEVAGGIVAPNVSRELSLVTYISEDLLQARAEILAICEATKAPDAPRIPSESACRRCRGKLRCPELRAQLAMVRAHITPPDLLPEDLAKVLDIAAPAKHLIDAAEKEAKRRLAADPNGVPGWALKPGNNVRHIDAQGAANATADVLPDEAFIACVKVSTGDLEEAFAAAYVEIYGGTKKAATEEFNRLLKPHIKTTQNAPSLQRVKELPE